MNLSDIIPFILVNKKGLKPQGKLIGLAFLDSVSIQTEIEFLVHSPKVKFCVQQTLLKIDFT